MAEPSPAEIPPEHSPTESHARLIRNDLDHLARPPVPHLLETSSLQDAHHILDPETNLVVVRTVPQPAFGVAISDFIKKGPVLQFASICTPEDLPRRLDRYLDESRFPQGEARDKWIAHIAAQTETYRDILKTSLESNPKEEAKELLASNDYSKLRVQLSTILPSLGYPTSGDDLGFHADSLSGGEILPPIRLLCTYRGPGTEWIPNRNVNPDAVLRHRTLGGRGGGEPLFNHPLEIHEMPLFAASFVEGQRFPGTGNPLWHRRPFTAEPRILLVVNVP